MNKLLKKYGLVQLNEWAVEWTNNLNAIVDPDGDVWTGGCWLDKDVKRTFVRWIRETIKDNG